MKDEDDKRKPRAGIELNSQFLTEPQHNPPKKGSLIEANESMESGDKLNTTAVSISDTGMNNNLEARHNL